MSKKTEGGLDKPFRRAIAWQDDSYANEQAIDEELRRVFDICHGCRRCFNLCDSFPSLFDLIDDSTSGELDTVASKDFDPVVDNCTLCDMCFMTKCPYVPPHEFDVDFPHLMLRARYAKNKKSAPKLLPKQLTKTDRNGKVATTFSSITNWATKRDNNITRTVLEKAFDVSKDAELPKYANKTLSQEMLSRKKPFERNYPAKAEKVVIYTTCFAEYNSTETGLSALDVLERQGIEASLVYPECCGMPQFEAAELETVTKKAKRITETLKNYVQDGYKIITLTPSCCLMMRQEWPLLLPNDEAVLNQSKAVMDLCEYINHIGVTYGLSSGLTAPNEEISVHIACHARALNTGRNVEKMLRYIPDIKLNIVERCSGHGGTWGMMKQHHKTAVKVGRTAVRQMGKCETVCSECPLAGMHIWEGIKEKGDAAKLLSHPIHILQQAYERD